MIFTIEVVMPILFDKACSIFYLLYYVNRDGRKEVELVIINQVMEE